jgi:hypothetical protein
MLSRSEASPSDDEVDPSLTLRMTPAADFGTALQDDTSSGLGIALI